jgi:prepilin-type N-terminal cleavage/methylation domain-containing protein
MKRNAFTLVELLVVIAIIGILVALLLPAVNAAREAARKTQCLNKFKQVGVAINTYQEANKRFPPGIMFYSASRWSPSTCGGSPPSVVSTGPMSSAGYSWSAFILPYVEEGIMKDSLNWKVSWGDNITPKNVGGKTNFQFGATVMNTFNCPSNPQSGTLVSCCSGGKNGGDDTEDMAHISMCAVIDSQEFTCNTQIAKRMESYPKTTTQRTANADGAFGNFRGAKSREFNDGLSRTLFIGEVLGAGGKTKDGEGVGPGRFEGHFWIGHNVLDTADGINGSTTIAGGKWPPADNSSGLGGNEAYRATGFASFHPGGCHFNFGDGSARLINEIISPNVLAALTTRAGGENIGDY